MRIVTHSCSNTEIVCALGCASMLVGVDDHSDHPVEVVATLPRVGPDLGVDPEVVRALDPDLVIVSLTVPGHERVVEQLERAGLPLLVLEPKSLADVARDVERVGQALGVTERARQLAADLRRAFREPEALPELAARPRILVEWWPKPVIVPGARSWVTDMIRIAGGTNPLGDRDVESLPLTEDDVRAARPDAVVVSWCGVRPENYRLDVVERRVGAWRVSPALAHGEIHTIPEAWMGRPGPRLREGIEALRGIVDRLRAKAETRGFTT